MSTAKQATATELKAWSAMSAQAYARVFAHLVNSAVDRAFKAVKHFEDDKSGVRIEVGISWIKGDEDLLLQGNVYELPQIQFEISSDMFEENVLEFVRVSAGASTYAMVEAIRCFLDNYLKEPAS